MLRPIICTINNYIPRKVKFVGKNLSEVLLYKRATSKVVY